MVGLSTSKDGCGHTSEKNQEQLGDEYDEEQTSEDSDIEMCPTVKLTKKEMEFLKKPWRQMLIIKVMGRKVSYAYLL